MANSEKDNLDLEFQISQYLDGQLTGRQLAAFQRRLAEDANLAEQLRLYSALDEQLGDMEIPGLETADFDAQRSTIMANLERKVLLDGHRRPALVLRPIFYVPLAAAASIVLALTIGMKFFMSNLPVNPTGGEVADIRLIAPLPPTGLAEVQIALSGEDVIPPPPLPPPPTVVPLDDLPKGTVVVSVQATPVAAANNSSERSDIPFMQF
ncbi:MAG: hypothetical protein EHM48_02060 [Planctomycetaceae bacterium]|nr:MAG: hypothetical protein EHM48_02060 [Planctomycetaceae bacterium]